MLQGQGKAETKRRPWVKEPSTHCESVTSLSCDPVPDVLLAYMYSGTCKRWTANSASIKGTLLYAAISPICPLGRQSPLCLRQRISRYHSNKCCICVDHPAKFKLPSQDIIIFFTFNVHTNLHFISYMIDVLVCCPVYLCST